MSKITIDRAVVERAMEALSSIDVGYRSPNGNPLELSFDEGKCEAAITALRAALAQQAEPVKPAPLKRGITGRCARKVCECEKEGLGPECIYLEPVIDGYPLWSGIPKAEPVEPVDVGLLEYRGNSVAFIHQKMTAYRAGIDAAWDAFRAKGLHPDGKTPLANMIAKYTDPPQRLPLTEEAISRLCDEYQSPRQLVRAVERAHGIKK